MKVEALMTRDVHTCHHDDSLNRAAQLMRDHDCGCVPSSTKAGASSE
jgi:predicted transcriptional regulator